MGVLRVIQTQLIPHERISSYCIQDQTMYSNFFLIVDRHDRIELVAYFYSSFRMRDMITVIVYLISRIIVRQIATIGSQVTLVGKVY